MRNPGSSFRNCGVYGQRTDEIAAPARCCAARRRRASSYRADQRHRAAAPGRARGGGEPARDGASGRELGLRVAIANVLPWNNGDPGRSADRRSKPAMRALAADEAVPVLPFHDTLDDPGATRPMRDEWTRTATTRSVEGYRRLGDACAASCTPSQSSRTRTPPTASRARLAAFFEASRRRTTCRACVRRARRGGARDGRRPGDTGVPV